MKWPIDDVINDFAEKVNITMLMVCSLSTKEQHTCYFPQKFYVFTIKRKKPLPADGRIFFLLIGEELSFDSIPLKITKASRVLSYFFSAFVLYDP